MSVKSKHTKELFRHGSRDRNRTREISSSSDKSIKNDKKQHKRKSKKKHYQKKHDEKFKPSYDDEFDVLGRDEISCDEINHKNDSSDKELRNIDKYEKNEKKRDKHEKHSKYHDIHKSSHQKSKSVHDESEQKSDKNNKEKSHQKIYKRDKEYRQDKEKTHKKHDKYDDIKTDSKSRREKEQNIHSDNEQQSPGHKQKKYREDKENEEMRHSKRHDQRKQREENETNEEEKEHLKSKTSKSDYNKKHNYKDDDSVKESKNKRKRKHESDKDNKKSKKKYSDKDDPNNSSDDRNTQSKSHENQDKDYADNVSYNEKRNHLNSRRDRNLSRKDERYERRNRSNSRGRSNSRSENKSKSRSRSRSRSRSSDYNFSRYKNEHNYRRRRNDKEIVMGRYWNDNEERRPRVKHIYEEDNSVELGERFYGGAPKKVSESSDNNRHVSKSSPKDSSRSENEPENSKDQKMTNQKRTVDLLTSRTGGAYIPPAKLKLMQAEFTDKSSAAYQRIAWESLKKSIQGHINKVNTSNIGVITRELLRENIIRGRGLLARSIIQAQATSPTFTAVYAALTAVINSKFAQIGELIVNRLAIQFKRAYRTNNKALCISTTTFIAHLVNQSVAHEILALEILTFLVEVPTNDSIEVAIAFLKECGMHLTQTTKKCVESIFEMLRNILHEGQLDRRIQYMIEVIFQIRKDGFKDHEAIPEELDLVEEENRITHLVNLVDAKDSQDILNVFKFDPEYEKNEEKYKNIIKDILDSDSENEDEDGSNDEDEDEDSSEEDEDKTKDESQKIIDKTGTNLTALRRTIYLTIQSSLDFEECAHKLMKMRMIPGQEIEFCHMFLDCCAEMRTYDKFYGLLAGRFCIINKIYRTSFEQIFKDSYETVHRLDTNKLRNISKFFAHLLFTDAMSWEVLSCVKLNEEDTTSSGRVFLKILFQELNEYMGLTKLNERFKDVTLQESFVGIFPRDNPRNTRFSINFFTAIGLGGLTDDLREHLQSKPKSQPIPKIDQDDSSSSDSSSSSSSISSSSSSSDSDSD